MNQKLKAAIKQITEDMPRLMEIEQMGLIPPLKGEQLELFPLTIDEKLGRILRKEITREIDRSIINELISAR